MIARSAAADRWWQIDRYDAEIGALLVVGAVSYYRTFSSLLDALDWVAQ